MNRHSITSAQVAALRLQSLGLVTADDAKRTRSPVEVVRCHLAMQAQDWGASRWAIGSRSDVTVDAEVLAAYDSGALVRSWPMRGTVHAVAAEDLHWMLALMGHRALSGVARRWQILGIDEALLERTREVALARLTGGATCTRAELLTEFREAGLDITGQRGYHAIWYLAQTGTLVMGPTCGGEQLLALLDEWIPASKRSTPDDPLAELARRYLAARGPATAADLVHWTKLTLRDCRAAFGAVREAGELVDLERDGEPMVMLTERWETLDSELAPRACGVQALAAFDEYLLGYRSRTDVLDPASASRITPGSNGVFRAMIVANGRVVGTWTKTRRARGFAVTVEPFTSLTKTQERAARRALERYGAFADTAIQVQVS